MVTIERYVAFICNEYEGGCGWADFFAASDDLAELKKKSSRTLPARKNIIGTI